MASEVGRTVLAALVAYFSLLTLIRILGKRTISKMNPGDFVVIVAIGSVAASFITFAEVSYTVGLTAIVTMLLLQFLSEWATSRVHVLRRLADGAPILLVHRGHWLESEMRRQNIDREDILVALREHGVGRLEDVQAVVLEVDGTLSVIAGQTMSEHLLDGVKRGEEARRGLR